METPTTFGETWNLWVEKAKNENIRWTASERSQFAEKATLWKKVWQKKKSLPEDTDPIKIDPTGVVPPAYVNSIISLLHNEQGDYEKKSIKGAPIFGAKKREQELVETHGKIQLLVKILTARTKYLEEEEERRAMVKKRRTQRARHHPRLNEIFPPSTDR